MVSGNLGGQEKAVEDTCVRDHDLGPGSTSCRVTERKVTRHLLQVLLTFTRCPGREARVGRRVKPSRMCDFGPLN